jgi:hypothetical protein
VTFGLARGRLRLCAVGIGLLLTVACAGAGLQIYPHPPGEPGTDPGPDYTGVTCIDPRGGCIELKAGAGERVRSFALVSVRITVEDVIDPPERVGPIDVEFLQPPLGLVPFRGRDRHLTVDMLADPVAARIGGRAFFETDAQALVGVYVIGMQRGGIRRILGRSTGTLGGRGLQVGRDRKIDVELLNACYPVITVYSRVRWLFFDGSDNLQPALTVSGCE